MLRRLATLVLIAAVTLAGVIACPRGGACCTTQVTAATHDCCAKGASLSASDCCDGISRETPRALNAATKIVDTHAIAALFAPPAALPTLASRAPRPAQDRGLAPPGTLTGQHTSLLL